MGLTQKQHSTAQHNPPHCTAPAHHNKHTSMPRRGGRYPDEAKRPILVTHKTVRYFLAAVHSAEAAASIVGSTHETDAVACAPGGPPSLSRTHENKRKVGGGGRYSISAQSPRKDYFSGVSGKRSGVRKGACKFVESGLEYLPAFGVAWWRRQPGAWHDSSRRGEGTGRWPHGCTSCLVGLPRARAPQ